MPILSNAFEKIEQLFEKIPYICVIYKKCMFKRAAAISLLLSANIILLAMAVVPHHHHGDAICFAGTHCMHGTDCGHGHDTTCDHREQDGSLPEHKHEHPQDANCCNVSEWLLPNVEPDHKHEHHCFCTDCDNNTDLFVAVLPDLSEPILQPTGLPLRQAPINETYLRIFVSRTLGLRAPPFDGTPIARI